MSVDLGLYRETERVKQITNCMPKTLGVVIIASSVHTLTERAQDSRDVNCLGPKSRPFLSRTIPEEQILRSCGASEEIVRNVFAWS